MIVLKTNRELAVMKKACQISAAALQAGGAAVRPGITTREINRVVYDFIVSKGAKPSFLGYGGFPATACISVNDQIIHGIPGDRVIEEGDIVSLDVGACINGYHGDNAATFPAGAVSDEAIALMEATKGGLMEGIKAAVPNARVGDIGHAVQTYVEERGFSVVREYTGHGVGKHLHEDPAVPNYGSAGHGIKLLPGMVIAIEPMVNQGSRAIRQLKDGWTVVTRDGSLSAHFENTIVITEHGPVILTQV